MNYQINVAVNEIYFQKKINRQLVTKSNTLCSNLKFIKLLQYPIHLPFVHWRNRDNKQQRRHRHNFLHQFHTFLWFFLEEQKLEYMGCMRLTSNIANSYLLTFRRYSPSDMVHTSIRNNLYLYSQHVKIIRSN